MNNLTFFHGSRLRIAAAAIAAVLLILGFSGVRANHANTPATGDTTSVEMPEPEANLWLVKEGKHSGIIFRTADTQAQLPLVEAQETSGPLVMISWGDAAYYQTEDKSLALSLRALLLPTKAAVNAKSLQSLADAVQTRDTAKVYAMYLDDPKLKRVLARVRYALASTSTTNEGGFLIGTANSYVGGSFYPAADRRYSLLYTCNNWVADVLQAGGMRFSKLTSQLAGGLVLQHKAAWLLSPRHRKASDFKSVRVVRAAQEATAEG